MFGVYGDNDNEAADRWFGGGTDLTRLLFVLTKTAKHFHRTYKNACDAFDAGFCPAFKKECDNYFVNWHRNKERRGIGGIFCDRQRPSAEKDVLVLVQFR